MSPSDFTPNPRGRHTGSGWTVMYLLPKSTGFSGAPIAWRYQGCEQHCREFIELSRDVGDEGIYYAFTDVEVFCPVCYSFTQPNRASHLRSMWNQTPFEIFQP